MVHRIFNCLGQFTVQQHLSTNVISPGQLIQELKTVLFA